MYLLIMKFSAGVLPLFRLMARLIHSHSSFSEDCWRFFSVQRASTSHYMMKRTHVAGIRERNITEMMI